MKHHPIQISIPQPCHEDWNKMTPREQGRFCDSCQKCVVDFTNFSDAELYQYLLDNAGKKACGRFRPSQLNRPIQIPHQPHSQLYKWIIAAGLALAISSAPEMKAFARVPFTSTIHNIDTFNPNDKENGKDSDKANTDRVVIKGYVKDIDSPIMYAQIQISTNGRFVAGALSDVNGYFELTVSASDTANASLIVNYIGYREYVTSLSSQKGIVHITLPPSSNVLIGDYIIIEHDPPLMNEHDGGHTKTLKSDELEKGAY